MSSKEPVNILLVDDQPAKLLSYETILADLHENLIRANSGKEALECLLKHTVAVVLVDVCMPELDGFELASMIRSHPRFQKTAIILVSGVFVEDVDRLKGYDSGAVDYVSVPIIPEILRAKVSVFTELYRKTEELQQLNQELERRVAERTAEIQAAADRLRQSEERLRLVLMGGGIQGWTWNILKNEMTWVTPLGDSACAFQSFSDFLAVVQPDDRAAVQKAFDHAVLGLAEYSAEYRVIEAGEEQWWHGRGSVIQDSAGRPLSIAGVNTNITRRKRAEQEKAELLKKAEDARLEAEKANKLKDQFLATLSHELRSPLNAITGWAHMLRSGTLDPATQIKAIDTINRNAMLQTQLISDILDVSRIASGKLRLDLKPVDLPGIIQAALDTIRPAAEAKNIHIGTTLCDVESITADPARLQQIVWNQLSNATKFAPRDGHVQVRLKKVSSNVELTIEDDGPGISPDFLPHIFEPFRQGDSSSTRSHQGLGLGLAIVRHLVERHGGSIEALNRQDGSGAIFKTTLPIGGRSPEAVIITPGEQSELEGVSLKGTRILVVDDDADARELVMMVLKASGAEVKTAASAGEAFAIVERELPDVIVADIEMPVEDGYSLMQKISALPSGKGGQTPVIALTAYASAQDRVKALGAGFRMHVTKPVQPPELVAMVASLIQVKL